MYQILLVEDSQDFQILLKKALAPIATVVVVSSLTDALVAAKETSFNLFLIDLELPDGSGFDFVKWIRANEELTETPIFLVTGNTKTHDKVMGFRLGIDDYIVKPFAIEEFRARVEARLAKGIGKTIKTQMVTRGNIRLDISLQKVLLIEENEEIQLTALEFKILLHLVNHENEVVSRENLINSIWGKNIHVGRSVDTHINTIRKKLGSCGNYIESVYAKGYLFKIS